MWQLRQSEVFSICLVAIVLELFTAALLLPNKGWILQYYLSALAGEGGGGWQGFPQKYGKGELPKGTGSRP